MAAWHFHLESLGEALVAELAPLGLQAEPDFQRFSYDEGTVPHEALLRVLEVLRRDLPDQLLGSVATALAVPGGRVVFDDLIETLRATNDKPETQAAVAFAIARHMKRQEVPTVCRLVLDVSIGKAGRHNLLPTLRRRRRAYPQVEDTLARLRADPDLGMVESMHQLDERTP